MKDILIHGLTSMGLSPTPKSLEQLETFARLLLEKNQVMNLTAIREPESVARLHFLDSAAVLAYGGSCLSPPEPSWLQGKSLLDVGTGAGFPGMVLKILEPSLQLTLLDSLGKRLDWLGEVCQTLGLEDVQRLYVRAEEQAWLPGFRDAFDVVTSRAVAALPQLTELCLPFVRPGGIFLAMKGAASDQEIAEAQSAVQRLGGEAFQTRDYTIPETETCHRLAAARKRVPTPKGYPRTWGKIKKTPLSIQSHR